MKKSFDVHHLMKGYSLVGCKSFGQQRLSLAQYLNHKGENESARTGT